MKKLKKRSFPESFKSAIAGTRTIAARERNFRIQIFIAIAAVAACIILSVDTWHFVLVMFAVFFVLAMELVNTSVEAIVDLICGDKQHPLAKIAKDAAAGAVLLASAFAVVVGVVVFIHVIGRF